MDISIGDTSSCDTAYHQGFLLLSVVAIGQEVKMQQRWQKSSSNLNVGFKNIRVTLKTPISYRTFYLVLDATVKGHIYTHMDNRCEISSIEIKAIPGLLLYFPNPGQNLDWLFISL